jgi:HK97 family phage portal protein
LFSESGVPSGVLKVEYELTPDESKRLRAEWSAARSGSRSTAVLSGGVSYEGIELSPADLAWLEYRAATALDVARIFHIPADLLEVAVDGSSLTYSNLAEVGADFVRYCLDPYLRIISEGWSLLPGESPSHTFDTRPLYKASAETRARTLQTLVASGVDPDVAATETEFSVPITVREEVPNGPSPQ